MLMSPSGFIHSPDFQNYTFEKATHFVRGFVFIYGRKAGADTVTYIDQRLHVDGEIPFSELHGSFDYFIVKNDGTVYAFSDNSNQQCLYVSGQTVGSSFLEMIEDFGSKGKRLYFSSNALCEYLTLGNVFFENTLANEISVLSSDRYALLSQGRVKVCSKNIGGIEGKSTLPSIQSFFDQLSYSVQGMHVCQALTGGYDSRMVFACTKDHLDMELGFSGNDEQDPDYICARNAAASCGKELCYVRTAKTALTDETVEKLLVAGDGIQPLSVDAALRLLQFKTMFWETGCTLHFTGDGGVLHKDWEWMQDLPFYNRRHTDVRRFYHQRIAFDVSSGMLGPSLLEEYAGQESRFVSALQAYTKQSNTQSYDSLYYSISGNRRFYYNANPVPGLISYAPLNELDLVRYSFHLPRRSRFFYNSMRHTICASDVRLARAATNYGTTASDEPLYLLRDTWFQGVEYGKKAVRMLGRKLFHVNAFVRDPVTWNYQNEFRCLPLTSAAVAFAKETDLIDPVAHEKALSYATLQRLVHIYWLASRHQISLCGERSE